MGHDPLGKIFTFTTSEIDSGSNWKKRVASWTQIGGRGQNYTPYLAHIV